MTTFLIASLFYYVWFVGGIAIGYHRLISHRSLAGKKIFEYFWVLGGYLAYQGSPIWWAAIHRAHHRHVETELDPHSPKYGTFHSYIGWVPGYIVSYPDHLIPEVQCKDLYKDKLYIFLEQGGRPSHAAVLNLLVVLMFHSIMWIAFGWQIGLAGLIATVVAFQVPAVLNTCCHIQKLGYRVHATEDDSVNVWWLGVFALGEGWHNNHHAFPSSSRAGIGPSEIDFCWMMIQLGVKLGIVTRANEPQRMAKAGTANALENLARVESAVALD